MLSLLSVHVLFNFKVIVFSRRSFILTQKEHNRSGTSLVLWKDSGLESRSAVMAGWNRPDPSDWCSASHLDLSLTMLSVLFIEVITFPLSLYYSVMNSCPELPYPGNKNLSYRNGSDVNWFPDVVSLLKGQKCVKLWLALSWFLGDCRIILIWLSAKFGNCDIFKSMSIG